MPKTIKVVIFGTSGHAKVIVDIIESNPKFELIGFVDNHLFVGKKVIENKTFVDAIYLNDDQKITAVAKLFSGEDSTSDVINKKSSTDTRAHG